MLTHSGKDWNIDCYNDCTVVLSEEMQVSYVSVPFLVTKIPVLFSPFLNAVR